MVKSKQRKKAEATVSEEKRYFEREGWREEWMTAITTPLADRNTAFSRLQALLRGPEPVFGAQSRPPSMDEKVLFYDFIYMLKIPATPQVIGSLDDFIHATFEYARTTEFDIATPLNEWCENRCLALSEITRRSQLDVDPDYIANHIYMARLFALDKWYSGLSWENLQQGVGLVEDEENDDSERMASCAQLLAGGQRIRKWCAGEGVEGNTNYWIGKTKEPVGKAKFAEILAALDTQEKETKNEWVKAVIAATKEHFELSKRDLTSGEVYEVIFEKTAPGVVPKATSNLTGDGNEGQA